MAVRRVGGRAALAGFPVAELWTRTAGVGRQLLLQLAWLGDARAILRPVFHGDTALPASALAGAALAGAIPLALAGVRLARGSATPAERVLVVTIPASALFGAWMYGAPNEFQLAFGLEPLFAVAAAALLTSRPTASPRAVGAVAALVLAARALTGVSAVALEASPANPMLSRAVQAGALERLRALGARDGELVTTTYNQAGVLEAWSGERLRPVHAWPVLRHGGEPEARARLERAWGAILERHRPRWVLLLAGANLLEGRGTDGAAIEAALRTAAGERGVILAIEADLPTESGAPGWRLVRLR